MGQLAATNRPTSGPSQNDAYSLWGLPDPTATTVTVTFANQTTAGGNAACFYRFWQSPTPSGIGTFVAPTPLVIFSSLSAPQSFTLATSLITPGNYVACSFTSNTAGNTNTQDITLSDGLANCAYGTRLQTGQKIVITLSTAAIAAAVLAAPELAFLEIAWDAMVGLAWSAGIVCNGPPPAFPVFTAADYLWGTGIPAPGSLGKFQQAWEAANWNNYCECIPSPGGGAPPAVPYRPLIPTAPTDVPAPVAPIICDGSDLCASLDAISKQLVGLAAQISLTRLDVQLIQRQHVPFGYVHGPSHSALSNDGDFAVSDILGLGVTFTTLPGIYDPTVGDPDTYHQIGKISVGTVDGWLRSWQPTHSPYMILDISGAVTKVGYSFKPGIVATITELIREP
jgi:hypothetical protein